MEQHPTSHDAPRDATRHARARAARVVRTCVPALTALLVLAGCHAGLPDMEPGRTSSDTTATSPAPSTTAPTASPTADTRPDDDAAPGSTEGPTTDAEPTPVPEPSALPEPSATPTTPPPTAEPPPPQPEQLERGASGDRVVAVQARLAELGYFIGPADGAFGPGTQQAVWALQKAAGISRDGVVGPATQAALDDGVRPSARSGSGKVVEIDLDRQLLLAVEDGHVVTVINASSGNGERFEAKGRSYRAGTPRGTFEVGRQVDANYESSLELGSMWRPKFFMGGIAVHGSGSIPPWPASHGCVRVANDAMNWIWDTWGAPPGTTVLVY